MQKLKALWIVMLLSSALWPFTAQAAAAKTYLGLSGISFDYIPFRYAKDQ